MDARLCVASAMEALSSGLPMFVKDRMVRFSRNSWLRDVERCLPEHWQGKGERILADPYVALTVLFRKWHPVFCPPLDRTLKGSVGRLRIQRNAWAHFELITLDQARATLVNTLALLRGVKAPEADEVAGLLREWDSRLSPTASAEVPRAQVDRPLVSFTPDGLESFGFRGFLSGSELMKRARGVMPDSPGVYLAMRAEDGRPHFLEQSPAGHFKGKDPTVPIPWLEEQWVESSRLLYVGQSVSMSNRVRAHLKFGAGAAVGAWGGRCLFQVEGSQGFLWAWMSTPGIDQKTVERDLLEAFADEYGSLPFANLRMP